ncbi:MAG: hypothetical protein GX096_07550 [Clostridiales bacterium]|nr:hypothetical protein [Clostridiales bacterium]
MEISKKIRDNKIFQATELSFDKVTPRSDEKAVVEAAILQPNGDYLIRIGAPNANTVHIIPWFGDPTPEGYAPWRDETIHCLKNEEGVFEAILPYDLRKTGPRNVEIYIDDTFVIWPYLPMFWSGGHPYNYLEIPDQDLEFAYIKDVPHGAISHEVYWSTETNEWERCLVYTPPGYMNTNESYPVLYLQHGGTENETCWTSTGRANYIMDNLIAAKECEPFIIVMNNGMIRYDEWKGTEYVDDCFENSLLKCCIPYIQSHYRVKTDKWNRAIAGLSMGSMQTNDIGFNHPDVFGNMASFTSTMYHPTFKATYERPWPKVMANPQQFMKDYKIFFCSATPQEDHIDLFTKDTEIMREAGIEGVMPGYRRVLHDGRFIRWDSWRMGLREFATMLFREPLNPTDVK